MNKATNCRSKILFFAPQTSGGKVVNPNFTEVGIQQKIEVRGGQKVIIESRNYKGEFLVSDVWNPQDDSGAVVLIKQAFGNIGEKDKAGLPIDTTGGWISVCGEDLQAGKIDKSSMTQKQAEPTGDEETAQQTQAPKKRKINWWIVLLVIILVIGLIWYFNRKKGGEAQSDILP
jgi:hypothetical protein